VRSIFSLLVKALYLHNKFQLQEIHKEVPWWTSKLTNDKFDVIATRIIDICQRKVKNLGYCIRKKKDKKNCETFFTTIRFLSKINERFHACPKT
jgi:GTP-sensing pleiotropic transcriptional regulator CodY